MSDERCGCTSGAEASKGAVTAKAAERPSTSQEAATDLIFKALASAQRRELLRIVASSTSADGSCCPTDVCACRLSEALALAPSTISHHMSMLVKAGLVTATKRGLWVYYGLERGTLSQVAQELLAL